MGGDSSGPKSLYKPYSLVAGPFSWVVPPSMNSIESEDRSLWHWWGVTSLIKSITHFTSQPLSESILIWSCYGIWYPQRPVKSSSWLGAMNFTIREVNYPLSHSVLSPPNTISKNFNCSLTKLWKSVRKLPVWTRGVAASPTASHMRELVLVLLSEERTKN